MFTRTILHLYGPFTIYSYGVMVALGCLLAYYLILKDPKRQNLFSEQDLIEGFSLAILVSVLGGRIFYLLQSHSSLHSFTDIVAVNNGGLSVMGTFIALLIFVPSYLYYRSIPIAPTLDLVSVYIPLLQAIARLGCFFAGCFIILGLALYSKQQVALRKTSLLS